MLYLLYVDPLEQLMLMGVGTWGQRCLGTWVAANNTDSKSKGPWPEGVFHFKRRVPLNGQEAAPDGKFGPGFIEFAVPDRTGMGVHAGRRTVMNAAGLVGPHHPTYGCIRTTNSGIIDILRMTEHTSPEKLVVLR